EHASEGQHEDTTVDYVIGVVMKSTGLSRAQAEQFHLHMWVFVHGLATMIATHFTSFTQEQINQLMAEEYQALRKLYGLAPVGK
ncbi:MAG: hypothetical protein PHO41_05645, partial [Eubacteriales bacterium]|nr:hypothetical protein [Eubacteriales bacterium]